MKQIDAAIINAWNSGADANAVAVKAAATGGLHNSIAPRTAVPPYVVYHEMPSRPEFTFDGTSEIHDYMFMVVTGKDASVAVINNIRDLLIAWLDAVTLTISGYTFIYCTRTFSGQKIFNEDDETWNYPTDYEIRAHKN
ncbi:MAG: hypothetical protein ABIH23_05960 [bacterium]